MAGMRKRQARRVYGLSPLVHVQYVRPEDPHPFKTLQARWSGTVRSW
jgi:hypothetical protein